MEPITALIAAISTALASGAKEVTENAIKDTYNAFKTKLIEKFGSTSKPVQAIENYEQDSDETYQQVLTREFKRNPVLADEELKSLADKLIQAVQQTEAGQAQFSKYLNQGETAIGVQGEHNVFHGDIVGKKS